MVSTQVRDILRLDRIVCGNAESYTKLKGIGTREVELERELSAVKEENVTLRADNEDLNNLVADYVMTLEKVLEGLRVYAVSSLFTCIIRTLLLMIEIIS